MMACPNMDLETSVLQSMDQVRSVKAGKDENEIRRIQKDSMSRNQLIAAARKGDEDAIESLTLEDMDIYLMEIAFLLGEDGVRFL